MARQLGDTRCDCCIVRIEGVRLSILRQSFGGTSRKLEGMAEFCMGKHPPG
jgi:hypothetical protein